MSVRQTTARGSAARDGRICSAPSCWDKGDRVEIDGADVDDAPVLCETHRKCYLGVSS